MTIYATTIEGIRCAVTDTATGFEVRICSSSQDVLARNCEKKETAVLIAQEELQARGAGLETPQPFQTRGKRPAERR